MTTYTINAKVKAFGNSGKAITVITNNGAYATIFRHLIEGIKIEQEVTITFRIDAYEHPTLMSIKPTTEEDISKGNTVHDYIQKQKNADTNPEASEYYEEHSEDYHTYDNDYYTLDDYIEDNGTSSGYYPSDY